MIDQVRRSGFQDITVELDLRELHIAGRILTLDGGEDDLVSVENLHVIELDWFLDDGLTSGRQIEFAFSDLNP